MIKKKGKFTTFIFSLLPGAGQMYLGFTKLGVSVMSLFFGIIFLSTFLEIAPSLLLLPVVWCYGFFDALNKNSLTDEEFYTLEDHSLIKWTDISELSWNFGQLRIIIAVVCILIGGNMLFSNFLDFFRLYIPEEIQYGIYSLTNNLPQFVVSILIILFGVCLIRGKKKELEEMK